MTKEVKVLEKYRGYYNKWYELGKKDGRASVLREIEEMVDDEIEEGEKQSQGNHKTPYTDGALIILKHIKSKLEELKEWEGFKKK